MSSVSADLGTSVRGRVLGREGDQVLRVELRVGERSLGVRTLVETVELIADDGSPVTVELGEDTTLTGVREELVEGAWERLAKQQPEAERFASVAPGPHVRASLVRWVLEPGAMLEVRGRSRAHGPGRRLAASELAQVAAGQTCASGPARPPVDVRRVLAAVVGIAAAAWYLRLTLLWPAELTSPTILWFRQAAAIGCATVIALTLAMASRRVTGGARLWLLPRFVTTDDKHGTCAFDGSGPIIFAGLPAVLGGIWPGVVLEVRLLLANLVEFDSPWSATLLCGLGMTVGIYTLWKHERLADRQARRFCPGQGWSLIRARVDAGALRLRVERRSYFRGHADYFLGEIDGPLRLDHGGAPILVEPKQLVWALDLGAPDQRDDDGTLRWSAGSGATALLAGRFEPGAASVAATGPESLLLFVSRDPDPAAALRRALWTRWIVLASGPLLGLLAALLIFAL
jgi:hypothetical protein